MDADLPVRRLGLWLSCSRQRECICSLGNKRGVCIADACLFVKKETSLWYSSFDSDGHERLRNVRSRRTGVDLPVRRLGL